MLKSLDGTCLQNYNGEQKVTSMKNSKIKKKNLVESIL